MLIVGSYNLQNKFKLNKYNGRFNNQDNVLLLKQFLDDYNIDILGTQEFVYWYLERARKVINDKYSINGKYRYPLLVLKKYDEANSIICKETVTECKTCHLPFLPNVIPRILTKAYIDTKEFGLITFYNTHLSVKNDNVSLRDTIGSIYSSLCFTIILYNESSSALLYLFRKSIAQLFILSQSGFRLAFTYVQPMSTPRKKPIYGSLTFP